MDGNFQVWKIGHYYFFIPCFCFHVSVALYSAGCSLQAGFVEWITFPAVHKGSGWHLCCSPQDLCFCQQCCVFSNKALIGKQNWFFTLLPPSLPSEAWAWCNLCCGVCFSVNCLYPWVCSHALPDVLAARLHPCPAPTSPGLLLVRPILCAWSVCVAVPQHWAHVLGWVWSPFLVQLLLGIQLDKTSSERRPGSQIVQL